MCMESHILHAGLRQKGAISFEINTLFWKCDKLEGRISSKQIPHALKWPHARDTRQTQLVFDTKSMRVTAGLIAFLKNPLYETDFTESNFDSTTSQYMFVFTH